jgi:hypothetical protein
LENDKSSVLEARGLQAPQGLLLYDMTAMKWKDDYDANLGPYERSNLVKSFYNSGSLDKVEWSSDAVKGLFVRQGLSGNGNGNVNDPSQFYSLHVSAVTNKS